MQAALVRVEAAVQKVFGTALITVFAVMVVVGGLQVFNRFVLNMSLSWSEELQRFGQAWLVFLGVPIAYAKTMHIGTTFFIGRLPKLLRKGLVITIDLAWGVIGVVLVITGL